MHGLECNLCTSFPEFDAPIFLPKEIKFVEKKKGTHRILESLFDYVINNCGDNQVIIAENEILPNVNYSVENMIEFTLEGGRGRYGFLVSER